MGIGLRAVGSGGVGARSQNQQDAKTPRKYCHGGTEGDCARGAPLLFSVTSLSPWCALQPWRLGVPAFAKASAGERRSPPKLRRSVGGSAPSFITFVLFVLFVLKNSSLRLRASA